MIEFLSQESNEILFLVKIDFFVSLLGCFCDLVVDAVFLG